MAQEDVSGLTQGAHSLADTVTRGINRIPTPGYRPATSRPADTSWHNEMVRQANRGFQQRVEAERAGGRAAGRAAVAKTPAKRNPKRTLPPRTTAKRK